MKYQNLLFLMFISFSFGFKNQEFFRKLNEAPDTEKFPEESDTSEPNPNVPAQQPDTTESTSNVPSDQPDSTTPESYNGINGTETDKAIPSIISAQTYPSSVKKTQLVLVGVGNYVIPPVHTPGRTVGFVVYYKMIIRTYILPIRMTVFIKVTYYSRLLRYLEEKDVKAVCDRYTYDEDPDIKYNCTFPVKEDVEIGKVISDGDFKFEGMDESIAPEVTMSSLVNETLRHSGIQTAVGDDLLRKQYLLNNTILEENGLKFRLMGEMDSIIPKDVTIVLIFDEKGDGNLKNAACNVSNLEGKFYELDCLAEKSINAHLNGVIGNTSSGEKIIIYVKEGHDEFLNTGSNYMGLYNRGSSSGLSTGSIVGIIIACIIALICIIIGVIICRKANISSPFKESQLGVNTNNIPIQDSSFGEYNSSTLNNVKSQFPDNTIEINKNNVTG